MGVGLYLGKNEVSSGMGQGEVGGEGVVLQGMNIVMYVYCNIIIYLEEEIYVRK